MSGAEPCTGSNSPGCVRSRRDVRARRHAHAALDRRRQVGEDVAEEVRRDDDVEAAGVAHHPRRERVDEHPLVADARELGGHLLRDLVPEHVAEARRVRLGRARHDAAPRLPPARRRGGAPARRPSRVKTLVSMPTSDGRPWCARPPTPEYSPSVFSRTKSMSTSAGPASGERARDPLAAAAPAAGSPTGRAAGGARGSSPRARRGRARTGRRPRPSAPHRAPVERLERSPSGIIRPCSCQWPSPTGSSVHSIGRPSASTACRASAITSGPTPSPGRSGDPVVTRRRRRVPGTLST